jgi:hypothetical protein
MEPNHYLGSSFFSPASCARIGKARAPRPSNTRTLRSPLAMWGGAPTAPPWQVPKMEAAKPLAQKLRLDSQRFAQVLECEWSLTIAVARCEKPLLDLVEQAPPHSCPTPHVLQIASNRVLQNREHQSELASRRPRASEHSVVRHRQQRSIEFRPGRVRDLVRIHDFCFSLRADAHYASTSYTMQCTGPPRILGQRKSLF